MSKYYEDIIVSIATATSNGAISIIRCSGKGSIEVVNKIFKGKDLTKQKSHTICYGHIVDEDEVLDEVLVSVFKAPKTFTAEDVVEVNCHGGIYVTNRVLEALLSKGCRLAEAGEFTKRAFLNGRIDLTQAEAVMDVINANSQNSLRLANRSLRGDVYTLISKLREKLLTAISKIEVNIDYPEYEDEEQITDEVIIPVINNLLLEINTILEKSQNSLILKNGINTAIVGKPNVGKSTILNKLIKEDKAIVTNIAGTTRDTIEGRANIGGVILNLVDTAGVRDTSDVVEKIGVEKSLKTIENVDFIMLVFDYSRELDSNDLNLLELTKDKKRLIIINKNDLDQKIDLNLFDDYLLISTENAKDIERLEDKIKDICRINDLNDSSNYISLNNARQISRLKDAKKALEDARLASCNNLPIDIVNIDLHHSWECLGEIIGEVNNDSLINELFSKFCLGK